MMGMVGMVGSVGAAVALCALLVKSEGTVLRGYRDPAGIVTACTGHTGADVVLGKRYTAQDCADWLASDVVKHGRALDCLHPPVDRPLAPHQRAALLSFTFNVGPGARGVKDGLCTLASGRPSSIARHAAAGDYSAMCAALTDWVYVAGRDCRKPGSGCSGIVTRRQAERELCEGKLVVDTPKGGA